MGPQESRRLRWHSKPTCPRVVCPPAPELAGAAFAAAPEASLGLLRGADPGTWHPGPLSPWKHLPSILTTLFPSKSPSLPALGFPELSVNLGFHKESESGPWSPAAVFCWDPAAETPSEAGTMPASTVEGGKQSSGGQRWPGPSPATRGAGQNARARSPSLEADCR